MHKQSRTTKDWHIDSIPYDSTYQQGSVESREQVKQNEGHGKHKKMVVDAVPLMLGLKHNEIIEESLQSLYDGVQKWKIGKFLGGGTFGRVYKALNSRTGVVAAVKKVTLLKEDEEESKEQIALLAKLHHENIVRYLQHYHFPDETWIFMEYVPQTLYSFYRDFGPPPYSNYLHLSRQLVTAAKYLHEHKIVHKDIKCENVLLTSRGVVKLTDYGCSKGFDRTISLKNYEEEGNKTQKGTPNWMAPESVIDSIYTRKTDIWSLGCTLLELATGKIPWAEAKLEDPRIYLHIGTTSQIPFIPDALHENIKKLIRSCLNRDPELRLGADELLKLIDTFNSQQSISVKLAEQ